MYTEWKPEPLGPFNRVIGAIPYSVVCSARVELHKANRFKLTRDSFYIRLVWKSLDWILNYRILLRSPWIRRERRTEAYVHWTSDEGWWIEDGKTGRRTRPMPKIIAAILCGTLIVVYPQILEVALAHAATAKDPNSIYLVLCLVTALLVSLVAFYMWVSHKSRPSGFEAILKGLGRSMGENKELEASSQDGVGTSGQDTSGVVGKQDRPNGTS